MKDLEIDLEEALAELVEGEANVGDQHRREQPGIDPAIPGGLVEYVRSMTRSPLVLAQVLDVASTTALRRMRSNLLEARRARWEKRWRPEEQDGTKRWLARIRDEVVRLHHLGSAGHHTTFDLLPANLKEWRPDETGALAIDEPATLSPSFGSPAFLEPTPIQILRWIHETWLHDNVGTDEGDAGLDTFVQPRVWDLTAGSGTSCDYFRVLHGCDLIASDLCVVASSGIAFADCRHVGVVPGHNSVSRRTLCRPETVISEPDIVLIDPPSMGVPGPSQIYGESPDTRDLAFLEREPWIFTIADVAVRATQRLALGGMVSLLVRCGIRFHQEVVADPELLEDLKTVLQGRAAVAHEMPLHYRTARNQISIGKARVPAVHLTLTRPT